MNFRRHPMKIKIELSYEQLLDAVKDYTVKQLGRSDRDLSIDRLYVEISKDGHPVLTHLDVETKPIACKINVLIIRGV